MDSAAVVLGQSLPFSSPSPSSRKELRGLCKLVAMGRRGPAIGILSSGFCDQGHLQYYNSKNFGSSSASAAVMNGKEDKTATMDRAPKKMKKKKQLKLLKELSRDLSRFSQMGFGLDGGDGGLADQINRDTMTEAADLILERLQKIRAQEKEAKRIMKQEKAKLKASQMQANHMDCEMSSASSSSSSESSDSECGEVVNVKNLKKHQKGLLKETESPITPPPPPPIDPIQSNVVCCAKTVTLSEENTINPKIEVCMGGKCKKSGGGMLLEEFKKAVGIEGAVSGCKCMGKCKEGPNVKVLNDVGVADNSVTSSNSLCIGVGVEDVEMIVANFMGQTSHSNNQMGFVAA